MPKEHGRARQRLFEMEEITFTEFVRNRRLEQAFRLLRDGSSSGSGTIASIDSEVGFVDLSTFNRAVRKRFDATPSDVRAASGVGNSDSCVSPALSGVA